MIGFERVTVTYPDAARPALSDVDLLVPEGELVVVVGTTGSGKSTLLRAINAHVPHFTGGTLAGRVTVDGRDTREHRPRDLADVVGVVGQDPLAGFVTDRVEDELAYAMESLGVAPATMRKRVEETVDLLGLADLRGRALRTLSGGERQRVAIGSVLTAHPRVLVLDEPTSALDPGAADDVLAALHRLVHDLGLTVVVAEHRLERVVHHADRVVRLTPEGGVVSAEPAVAMATSPVAPPVVELGRLVGWDPLPLTVRDARRRAGDLRARLSGAPSHARGTRTRTAADVGSPLGNAPVVEARALTVVRGGRPVLRSVDLTVRPAEVVAVMGRNGAGKSTLLGAFAGVVEPDRGQVRLLGARPTPGPDSVGLVPQDPADLLLAETVAAECADADRDAAAPAGTTQALLERLAPGVRPTAHPREVSEGQRLALALAVVLAGHPRLLLLDEPTRGLDYPAKARLVALLAERAAGGTPVVVATHDVELVAELAHRVVVLADGDVVADGPTAEVVVASPAFAPQVAKILAPGPWLTVDDVAADLRAAG